MPNTLQQDRHFEQAIATIFACRSVIKYNSSLQEEQRNELIREIDQTLQYLHKQLPNSASVVPLADQWQRHSMEDTPIPSVEEAGASGLVPQQALQKLYKLYYAYLGVHQKNNIETFMLRFSDTLAIMNELQLVVEERVDAGISLMGPLERVRSFVTDLYGIFVEFMRELSEALEANDVHVDTEELAILQKQLAQSKEPSGKHSPLASLLKAYQEHQQLDTREGSLFFRIRDITAFFEFLKEYLPITLEKREEIMAQVNSVTSFLKDLIILLSNYEVAASLLLQSE